MVKPCKNWTGAKRRGYGAKRYLGRTLGAHRIAWIKAYGDPGKLYVLHKCDNPACIQLNHLYLGTQKDNMRDRIERGRYSNGSEHRTTCKFGHPLSQGKNQRYCQTCRNTGNRRYRATSLYYKQSYLARLRNDGYAFKIERGQL